MPDATLPDYAIVVGVNRYRHKFLSELKGAVGDTIDFLEWLISQHGGNVPHNNIYWFCTPEPKAEDLPAELQSIDVQPARRDGILDVMGEFIELAEANDYEPIGRRLYLYFSGHGVSKSLRDRCFLSSDHSMSNDRYLVGPKVADVFVETAIFHEVLLFMDCCQVYDEALKDIPLDLRYKVDAKATHDVEWLHTFAGRFGETTREKEMENGKFRGILSRSILDGLQGGAATDEKLITASGLKKFIERRFVQLRDPDSEDEPHIPPPDKDFVIAVGVEPVVFMVDVEVRLTDPDSRLIVEDGGNNLEPVETDPEPLHDNWVRIRLVPGKKYLFKLLAGDDSESYQQKVHKTIVVGGDNRVRF